MQIGILHDDNLNEHQHEFRATFSLKSYDQHFPASVGSHPTVLRDVQMHVTGDLCRSQRLAATREGKLPLRTCVRAFLREDSNVCQSLT